MNFINSLPVLIPLFSVILGYVGWTEYAKAKGWKSHFQREYDHWYAYASDQIKKGNLHPMFDSNANMWDDWTFDGMKWVPPFTPENAPTAFLRNWKWENGKWIERENLSIIQQWKNRNQPEFG